MEKMTVLKDLQEAGFNFGGLPEDLQKVVSYLGKYTKGTYVTENQKINVLIDKVWQAIQVLSKEKQVAVIAEKMSLQERTVVNNGFNTPEVMQEEETDSIEEAIKSMELLMSVANEQEKKEYQETINQLRMLAEAQG